MKIETMDWDNIGTKAYRFFCPGCEENHAAIQGRWTFNDNYENPTFSPSILVSGTKMTPKGTADYEAWCESGYPKREESFDSVLTVCHSFVTEGKIQFLSDCTHALAGKTVELPDLDEV